MSGLNLQGLLLRLVDLPHETEWVEFKRDNEAPEEIGEYLSAISNSRIIGETIEAGLIKVYDPENRSRKHARYVPYWA